jgi:hypothetical protein
VAVQGNDVAVACDDHAGEGMLMHVKLWPLILKDLTE